MTKTQNLLQQNPYCFWTDGRRIMAYNASCENHQDDKDEEFIQLLKNIIETEIDDFPSHIIEYIKNIWKILYSLRLSVDLLILDKIE